MHAATFVNRRPLHQHQHHQHRATHQVAAGGGEAIHWVNPSTLLLFFGPTAFLFVIHYCECCRRLIGCVCTYP